MCVNSKNMTTLTVGHLVTLVMTTLTDQSPITTVTIDQSPITTVSIDQSPITIVTIDQSLMTTFPSTNH